MRIAADVLRGYTDVILLRQLAEGDSYGYRINRQVSEKSEGNLELKEATLYTAFRRMEGAGLIRSYWGNEETGARRRYYTLTAEGRQRLTEETAGWQETSRMLSLLICGPGRAASSEQAEPCPVAAE